MKKKLEELAKRTSRLEALEGEDDAAHGIWVACARVSDLIGELEGGELRPEVATRADSVIEGLKLAADALLARAK